jgi:hypothetical protein
MSMDYEKLFGDLFDDLERAAGLADCNDGFVNDAFALLRKYAEQRGKGEEYERMRQMDE